MIQTLVQAGKERHHLNLSQTRHEARSFLKEGKAFSKKILKNAFQFQESNIWSPKNQSG
jgi:hypothetical protein